MDNVLRFAQKIISFTPPLYVEVKANKHRPVSSCLLAKCDQHYFLITAAHTLKTYSGGKLGVVFKNRFLTIGGEISHTRSANVIDDKFDIGFYKLDPDFYMQLPDSFDFLDLKNFDATKSDTTGQHYMIAGHPATRISFRPEERKIDMFPFLLISDLNMTENILERNGFKRATHQLINYRPRKIYNYITKEMIQGPKPNGLSGCGIWDFSSVLSPDQKEPKVCPTAIVIEHIKEASVLVATKIGVAVELLRHSYDLDLPKSLIFRAREN
jgi:hypothetical protein